MDLALLAPLPRVALMDANVLFAPRLCDLFMHLHLESAIRIHWTAAINDEWTRNAAAKTPGDPSGIQRRLDGMIGAIPDWEVSGYDNYLDHFAGVDPKDRRLRYLYHEEPSLVVRVAEQCRTKLKVPPRDRAQYVALLVKMGCELARDLGHAWEVPCPTLMPDGTVVYRGN